MWTGWDGNLSSMNVLIIDGAMSVRVLMEADFLK